jgi:hypothetical protein
MKTLVVNGEARHVDWRVNGTEMLESLPAAWRILTLFELAWMFQVCTLGCEKSNHVRTPEGREYVVFRGACDASAAMPLTGNRFAVADDEDNVLRVYDAAKGGEAVTVADLSKALDLPLRERVPEADIEAATAFGDYALWLTSHGLTKHGTLDPARARFFATRSAPDGTHLEVVGKANQQLLASLVTAPQLAQLDLASAARRKPKDPGGLNIEGMTQRLDRQSIWIGFRNPVPAAKALLVPLLNPLPVALDGATAEMGDPVLLDLAGLGVRALGVRRGRYVIVAGPIAGSAGSRLYTWDGREAPIEVNVDLSDFNPEALILRDDRDDILLLSDDGTRKVAERECKKLVLASDKSFRGMWLRLP